jgi:hypothetical protein
MKVVLLEVDAVTRAASFAGIARGVAIPAVDFVLVQVVALLVALGESVLARALALLALGSVAAVRVLVALAADFLAASLGRVAVE